MSARASVGATVQPPIGEDEEVFLGAEEETKIHEDEPKPRITEVDMQRASTVGDEGSFLLPLQEDPEQPLHLGGSRIKIMIVSGNMGNTMVRDLNPWIPEGAPGVDIVVVGMQESTYSLKKDGDAGKPPGGDSSDEEGEPGAGGGGAGVGAAEAPTSPPIEGSGAEVRPATAASTRDAKAAIGDGDFYSNEADKHLLNEIKMQLGDDFEFLHGVRRRQMRLRVYVRTEIADDIKELESGAENTGLAHVVANKGGQVIKIQVRNTTLCFVSSHLAAHEGKMAKRNDNITEIVQGVRMGDPALDMYQFDHIIWFGDMNYRISIPDCGDKEEQWQRVKDLIDEGNFKELWGYDELGHEVLAGRALADFHSAPCDFKPTFKVKREVGTSYNQKRTPSYCDRVLWRSLPGHAARLRMVEWTSAEDFCTSDHKPVRAVISVEPSPEINIVPHVPNGWARYPQLKFFNLSAKGLAALDCGVVLTKSRSASSAAMTDEAAAACGTPKHRNSAGRQSVRMELAKSDPYIIFKTNPPDLLLAHQQGMRTEKIRQTLDPTWQATPVLSFRVGSYEELAKIHVTMQIMDHDMFGPHDLIGTVTLALSDICAAADSDTGIYEFTADVMRYSTKHGTLSGSIEVNTPGPSNEHRWQDRLVDDARGLAVASCNEGCNCSVS